jgi:hypothetical protein
MEDGKRYDPSSKSAAGAPVRKNRTPGNFSTILLPMRRRRAPSSDAVH